MSRPSAVAGRLGQAHLRGRAQHAVRPLTPHLSPGDLEATRQAGADRGERHQIADGEVPRPAGDLKRLAGAGVDVHQTDPLGVGVGPDVEHLGHHDVVEAGADLLDTFDDQAEAGEGVRQFGDVGLQGPVTRSQERGAREA